MKTDLNPPAHRHFELLRQLYGESDANWLLGYERAYREQHGTPPWPEAPREP